MTAHEIVRAYLRTWMITCNILGGILLAFGILLAVCLTGHTIAMRVFLSGVCIVCALVIMVSSIWMYREGVRRHEG